jgi:hypothetical protein
MRKLDEVVVSAQLRVKCGKLSPARCIGRQYYRQAENEGKNGLTTLRFTGQDN